MVGVELEQALLARTRARAEQLLHPGPRAGVALCRARGERLPFPDGAFDRVIAAEVIEHVPAPGALLRELVRVLRPGGLLALSFPRAWPERICWWLAPDYAAEPGGHVRIVSPDRLEREARDLGLELRHRHGAHALHTPYWWLQCLLWRTRGRSRLVRVYRRWLEHMLLGQSPALAALERRIDPWLGKSMVLYFERKPDGARPGDAGA